MNTSIEMTQDPLQFYPFEINGTKYTICKLPNQPFSTLHDPDTKQMVGQWNNTTTQYEIFQAIDTD
jgi:hypothetical protein